MYAEPDTGDHEFNALTPAEVFKQVHDWLEIQRFNQEALTKAEGEVRTLGGWPPENVTTKELDESPISTGYILIHIEESRQHFKKAQEWIQTMFEEASKNQLQDYHLGRLRLLQDEADAHRRDLHSTVRPHYGQQFLPHTHPAAGAFGALDELIGILDISFDYSDLQRTAVRLKGEVGMKIVSDVPTPPSLHDEAAHQFHYLNLITDTEAKMLWREDEREKAQRFQGNSLVYHLWLLLLENVGSPQEKKHLIHELRKRTHREDERLDADISKGLENLQRKLKEVSREDWSTVRSWFEETPKTILLKTLG